MENWQKGEIADLKVQLRAAEKGVIISKPALPNTRYDCILDDGVKLTKAQIKWAGSTKTDGVVTVDLRKMGCSREYRTYTTNDFELLLVYIPQIDRICAFLPDIWLNSRCISIRFQPTKNGQVKGCIFSDQYLW